MDLTWSTTETLANCAEKVRQTSWCGEAFYFEPTRCYCYSKDSIESCDEVDMPGSIYQMSSKNGGIWTDWMNHENAPGGSDNELRSRNPSSICNGRAPADVQCRVSGQNGTPSDETGQMLRTRCSVDGLECLDSDNQEACLDYEVRYFCFHDMEGDYELVGDGYCRTPDTDSSEFLLTYYRQASFVPVSSDVLPTIRRQMHVRTPGMFVYPEKYCEKQCSSDPECLGYAITKDYFEFPERCHIYAKSFDNFPSKGWRKLITSSDGVSIGMSDNTFGVQCFRKLNNKCDAQECVNGEIRWVDCDGDGIQDPVCVQDDGSGLAVPQSGSECAISTQCLAEAVAVINEHDVCFERHGADELDVCNRAQSSPMRMSTRTCYTDDKDDETFLLSVANGMFSDCADTCVYNIHNPTEKAYEWIKESGCWDLVTIDSRDSCLPHDDYVDQEGRTLEDVQRMLDFAVGHKSHLCTQSFECVQSGCSLSGLVEFEDYNTLAEILTCEQCVQRCESYAPFHCTAVSCDLLGPNTCTLFKKDSCDRTAALPGSTTTCFVTPEKQCEYTLHCSDCNCAEGELNEEFNVPGVQSLPECLQVAKDAGVDAFHYMEGLEADASCNIMYSQADCTRRIRRSLDTSHDMDTVYQWKVFFVSCVDIITDRPSFSPTFDPTSNPSVNPTPNPSTSPTVDPSVSPTVAPTIAPTDAVCTYTRWENYYVREGYKTSWWNSMFGCYGSLAQAKYVCDQSPECHAISKQDDRCSGMYRVTYGGPTLVHYTEEEDLNIFAWEKKCDNPESPYDFVGDGWCRPGRDDTLRTNSYRGSDHDEESCKAQCYMEDNCLGYAIADALHGSSSGVCEIYVTEGTIPPPGWTSVTTANYGISSASGDPLVDCFRNSGNECFDLPGWEDSDGKTCEDYTSECENLLWTLTDRDNPTAFTDKAMGGLSAREACCICGKGMRNDEVCMKVSGAPSNRLYTNGIYYADDNVSDRQRPTWKHLSQDVYIYWNDFFLAEYNSADWQISSDMTSRWRLTVWNSRRRMLSLPLTGAHVRENSWSYHLEYRLELIECPFVDGYNFHADTHCGGQSIHVWADQTSAHYTSNQMEGIGKCAAECDSHNECAGFIHRERDDKCGFWKSGPLALSYAFRHNCYEKIKPTEGTTCASRMHSRGCATIITKGDCLTSRESSSMANFDTLNSPCVWCENGCTDGHPGDKCVPKVWLDEQADRREYEDCQAVPSLRGVMEFPHSPECPSGTEMSPVDCMNLAFNRPDLFSTGGRVANFDGFAHGCSRDQDYKVFFNNGFGEVDPTHPILCHLPEDHIWDFENEYTERFSLTLFSEAAARVLHEADLHTYDINCDIDFRLQRDISESGSKFSFMSLEDGRIFNIDMSGPQDSQVYWEIRNNDCTKLWCVDVDLSKGVFCPEEFWEGETTTEHQIKSLDVLLLSVEFDPFEADQHYPKRNRYTWKGTTYEVRLASQDVSQERSVEFCESKSTTLTCTEGVIVIHAASVRCCDSNSFNNNACPDGDASTCTSMDDFSLTQDRTSWAQAHCDRKLGCTIGLWTGDASNQMNDQDVCSGYTKMGTINYRCDANAYPDGEDHSYWREWSECQEISTNVCMRHRHRVCPTSGVPLELCGYTGEPHQEEPCQCPDESSWAEWSACEEHEELFDNECTRIRYRVCPAIEVPVHQCGWIGPTYQAETCTSCVVDESYWTEWSECGEHQETSWADGCTRIRHRVCPTIGVPADQCGWVGRPFEAPECQCPAPVRPEGLSCFGGESSSPEGVVCSSQGPLLIDCDQNDSRDQPYMELNEKFSGPYTLYWEMSMTQKGDVVEIESDSGRTCFRINGPQLRRKYGHCYEDDGEEHRWSLTWTDDNKFELMCDDNPETIKAFDRRAGCDNIKKVNFGMAPDRCKFIGTIKHAVLTVPVLTPVGTGEWGEEFDSETSLDATVKGQISWSADGVWYYQDRSTCVGQGQNGEPCNNAELYCAGDDKFGGRKDQVQAVETAIENGGVHPDCPNGSSLELEAQVAEDSDEVGKPQASHEFGELPESVLNSLIRRGSDESAMHTIPDSVQMEPFNSEFSPIINTFAIIGALGILVLCYNKAKSYFSQDYARIPEPKEED